MQIGIREDFLKSKQKWRSLLCERLIHTPEFSFYWKHKKCCQESTLLKILFFCYLAFVPSLRCSKEIYRINLLNTSGIKIKITSENFRCLLVIIIYYCGKRNFKFRSIILPLQVKETLCVCVCNNLYTHIYTTPGLLRTLNLWRCTCEKYWFPWNHFPNMLSQFPLILDSNNLNNNVIRFRNCCHLFLF